MAVDATLHVGDIGTRIIMTVKDQDGAVVDLSGFTSLKLRIKYGGTVVERNCVFLTNGTDGKIYYVTIDGDLPVVGKYKFQVKGTSAGGTWYSSIQTRKVEANV